MKNIFKLNNEGVTLVETLIVMGLLSILLLVMSSIFTSAADVQQQSKSYSATSANGRYFMARLNYDIANATSVTIPTGLGVTSPNLELVINGKNFIYALSGGDLQLNDSVSADNLNSDDTSISALSFQELGNIVGKPTVSYTFTVTSVTKNHGVNESQVFNGTVGLK